jgi:hypothetical protein
VNNAAIMIPKSEAINTLIKCFESMVMVIGVNCFKIFRNTELAGAAQQMKRHFSKI